MEKETSLKVIASFHAFESNGNEVQGIKNFAYLDINVAKGQEFGTKRVTLSFEKKQAIKATIKKDDKKRR